MINQAQLIAYVDRLTGGTFRDVAPLLEGPFEGAFGGVHLLPVFHPIDGADAGFDPIDHTQVDRLVMAWENGRDAARLDEDLANMHADVTATGHDGGEEPARAWSSTVEA